MTKGPTDRQSKPTKSLWKRKKQEVANNKLDEDHRRLKKVRLNDMILHKSIKSVLNYM